ncbi:hypothetical protein Aperf_G00000012077 [Anoplocephala perfoliata]
MESKYGIDPYGPDELEKEFRDFGFLSATSALRPPAVPIPSSSLLPTSRKSEIKVPKMKSITLSSVRGCVHEVILPVGVDRFESLMPMSGTPAKKYPFQLDPFQREAILCIENDQSVLVSAHTSAGKTVVAEYAIARCLANNQRVIYTTPIKALSNQKYREFTKEFKDVGLLTGDNTINRESALLIMTTEILRQMLYKGNEIIENLGWVIFDEVHYMREKERGVVWEESIILLPDRVRQVFLSATIPNAHQFAEWVAFLHKLPCHVVSTDNRPTPLQYYVSPSSGNSVFLVVDKNRRFDENSFNRALGADIGAFLTRKSTSRMRTFHCSRLIRFVEVNNLLPLIVFSFSKTECQYHANKISDLDFTDEREKALVDAFASSALASLSVEDRRIPQISEILSFLRRGIGIHHGGLLPILRELVEILFSEGYLKVLFATETFAMGVNMPARTVLFTTTEKFDGRTYRSLSSGECIQMSGRAGRRGKDDLGTVILMIDNTVTSDVAKRLLLGDSDPLNSAFTFSYNSVLNWLSIGDINPRKMLEKSFLQFQSFALIPSLEQSGELSGKESLLQLNQLHSQKRVLHRLGFCTEADVISLKGRIAREISFGDELLLTELLVNGFFRGFTPAQIAGVVSCFVPERSGSKSAPQFSPDMQAALETIRSKARELATIIEECRVRPNTMSSSVYCAVGVQSAVEDYVKKFTGEFMEVVRCWAEGVSFAKLLEKYPMFSGNVIRCLRRLDELLKQMQCGAKVAGDGDMETKFAKASCLIRRDIAFAPSLYLSRNF